MRHLKNMIKAENTELIQPKGQKTESLKRARMVFKDQQKSDKLSTTTTEEARNNKIKLQQDKFSK